jgi:hypothetical protein
MPYGKGTYGSKRGRPPAKAKKSSLNTTMKGRSSKAKKKK